MAPSTPAKSAKAGSSRVASGRVKKPASAKKSGSGGGGKKGGNGGGGKKPGGWDDLLIPATKKSFLKVDIHPACVEWRCCVAWCRTVNSIHRTMCGSSRGRHCYHVLCEDCDQLDEGGEKVN